MTVRDLLYACGNVDKNYGNTGNRKRACFTEKGITFLRITGVRKHIKKGS